MDAPTCRMCGAKHWSSQACAGAKALTVGPSVKGVVKASALKEAEAATTIEGYLRRLPLQSEEIALALEDAATKGWAVLRFFPDGTVARLPPEEVRDTVREQRREYMRAYRARKSGGES